MDLKSIMQSRRTLYLLLILVSFNALFAYGVVYFNQETSTDYQIYVLREQYVTDNVYTHGLHMKVQPVNLFYDHKNESVYWKPVGEIQALYFDGNMDLIDASENEIIVARWIDSPFFKNHISGVWTLYDWCDHIRGM